MEYFELLVMLLSALSWQRYNGSIKLVADEVSLDFLKKQRITEVYDGGLELLEVDNDIKPHNFWAAGKIYALRMQNEPVALIDNDLIIWKNISDNLLSCDVAAMHYERLDSVYPDIDYFNMSSRYSFNSEWDWSLLPVNTALIYLKNQDFKDYYTQMSIKFMKNSRCKKDDVCESMVFAEQRLLSMCAAEKSQFLKVLLNYEQLNNQDGFTHIWGHKRILRGNYYERKHFINKCMNRIRSDYPEYYEIAEEIIMP